MSIEVDPNIKAYMLYGVYHGMNQRALEQYITDSVDILAFWNHVPLMYIVKSRLGAAILTQKFYPFFEGRLFIVAEINTENVAGWLPPAAWEWFRTPAPPTKNPRPAQGGLLGLFAPPKT